MVAAVSYPPVVDIAQHQGLVRMFARRYERWIRGTNCLSFEDLCQVGNLGLIRAAKGWEPEKGAFSTYAKWWVCNYIRREILHKLRTVRVPEWAQRDGRRHPKRTAPIETNRSGSINADESDHQALITDFMLDRIEPDETPEETVSRAERTEMVPRIFRQLSCPRERAIIRKRFFEGLTLQQVGDSIGLTKERVRQIEAEALKKLRQHAQED